MINKQKILLPILLIIHLSVFGQRIGFEEIDDSKVSPWIAQSVAEYQYVYHFGESEMESDLVLIIEQNKCYAQIKSGLRSDNRKEWLWHYENLMNVRIEGNKFYSDKTKGEFVIYHKGKEKIKGLKVYNSWSGLTETGEYEIGTKSQPISNYYSGKFMQASVRPLSKKELLKIAKSDLKIMRNEIFARYGYQFKKGGKMDLYFKSQNWYKGQHKSVNKFLSNLEKANIKLIQQVENEK